MHTVDLYIIQPLVTELIYDLSPAVSGRLQLNIIGRQCPERVTRKIHAIIHCVSVHFYRSPAWATHQLGDTSRSTGRQCVDLFYVIVCVSFVV